VLIPALIRTQVVEACGKGLAELAQGSRKRLLAAAPYLLCLKGKSGVSMRVSDDEDGTHNAEVKETRDMDHTVIEVQPTPEKKKETGVQSDPEGSVSRKVPPLGREEGAVCAEEGKRGAVGVLIELGAPAESLIKCRGDIVADGPPGARGGGSGECEWISIDSHYPPSRMRKRRRRRMTPGDADNTTASSGSEFGVGDAPSVGERLRPSPGGSPM